MFASTAVNLISRFAGCGLAATARASTGGASRLLGVLRSGTAGSISSNASVNLASSTSSLGFNPSSIAHYSTPSSSSSNNNNEADSSRKPDPSSSKVDSVEGAEGATPSDASPVAPSGPASRRDTGAAAETIYPSSQDDNLGVQRNWFNALFSQLNVVHRTGMVPHMKGRQKEVFVAVEREFETLWERHVRDKGLKGTAHRGMLLCCLAIATHRVLRYETGDDELVKEIVRTNLGGMAVGVMMRLHKARLWLLLKLLAEDPYKQAVRFLPTLQGDLGELVVSHVEGDLAGQQPPQQHQHAPAATPAAAAAAAASSPPAASGEAVWRASSCGFHSVLAAEEATELLPEFCCQYGMQWLEEFAPYGVRVGLEQSMAYGDECCLVRISRPWTMQPPPTSASAPASPPVAQAPPAAAAPPVTSQPQDGQQQQ
ncbi:hypothetical protein Agub_g7112 [Astrephomene gubernaculifera]|uniref:Uncharacterized protein n=1 Tax=Astrephomene gubernaculifera TaxID=47775 RepID=A0AAD3HM66_9CHLO|nr:hypothetical protein Agub_g7112 [Astrephomene gubernaculifera]